MFTEMKQKLELQILESRVSAMEKIEDLEDKRLMRKLLKEQRILDRQARIDKMRAELKSDEVSVDEVKLELSE